MREIYSDLDIQFQVDHTTFFALNIANEQILAPIPKHHHGNGSYEIHFIRGGFGTVRIQDDILPLTPNTLYVTGPFVEHEQIPLPEDPMVEYAVYLKMGALLDPAGSVASRFSNRHYWFGEDSEHLDAIFEQLFFELRHRYVGYTNQVRALLQQGVVKLLRNYEKESAATQQFTAAGRFDSKYFFVEKTLLYNVETVTLASLSRELGLSTRQTERFMKETYGKTFQQKKLEARMAKAASLLKDSELPIMQIAEQLRYASIQHFSSAFKKYYGVSPTKYRSSSK